MLEHRTSIVRGTFRVSTALFLTLLQLLLVPQALSQESIPSPVEKLVVGCEYEYLPFCGVSSDGQARGFAVDLLKEAAGAVGLDVEFRTEAWVGLVSRLSEGSIQVLPAMGRTRAHYALVEFSTPYASADGVLVVRSEIDDISGIDDLAGKTVGVLMSDYTEDFLNRANPAAIPRPARTFADALTQLSEWKLDAVLAPRPVAERLIKDANLANLRIVRPSIQGFRQEYCFAVSQSDRPSLARLNEGLAMVMSNGAFERIHAAWFPADEPPTHRRIVVGGDYDLPPFEFVDENGEPAGLSVDIVRAVARVMNLDVEFRMGSWREVRDALIRGEVDVLQSIAYSAERDQSLDFSPPHTTAYLVPVVRRGVQVPKSVSELGGKRIAVVDGGIAREFLTQAGLGKAVIAADSAEIALSDVVHGKVDCAVVHRRTAQYFINRHQWNDLVLGDQAFASIGESFAVAQGRVDLLAKLSDGLSLIEKSGELHQIQEKWLGVAGYSPTYRDYLKQAAKVVVPLILLLLLSLAWLWSLRRQVRRKTAQLRESEQRLKLALEAAQDALWDWNVKSGSVYYSPRYYTMLGYEPGEFEPCYDAWFSRLHPEDLEHADAAVMNGLKMHEGFSTEFRMKSKGGDWIWILARGRVVEVDASGAPVRMIGTHSDVSARKRSEAVMAARVRLLERSRTGEFSELLTATVDEAEALTASSAGFYHFVEEDHGVLSIQAWSTNTLANLCRMRDAAGRYPIHSTGVWSECIRRRGPVVLNHASDMPVLKEMPEGHAPIERMAMVPVLRGETVVAILGVGNKVTPYTENDVEDLATLADLAWDVVESRRAEDARRQMERRLQAIFNHAAVGIAMTNAENKIIAANQAFTDLVGYTEDELRERTFMDITHPDDLVAELESLRAFLDSPARFNRIEKRYVRKDGSHVWVDLTASIIRDEAGGIEYAIAVVHDLTHQKKVEHEQERLQAELAQAQKMESVGRLAGGVAHDFNNMLGVILGHLELVLGESPLDPSTRESLLEVQKAAKRSADLTRQLLAFARKQIASPKVLDLNDTVGSMLKMLSRLIGEHIQLRWQPGAGLAPVLMDPSQVDQILANLCVNARDAIQGVGAITIATAHVDVDEKLCERHLGASPGPHVRLTVSDTGCGMDHETLEALFEPFFTTKDVGQGTGLGLATVYGIVKQNHGFITVDSVVGKGTTFDIYLPAYGALETPRTSAEPTAPMAQGNETILLVEDEPGVLRMTQRMLRHQGYAVLAAGSPEEAIRIAESHPGPIALLVTDVVMPTMNGRDLAERLRARHPGLKRLYMSGYAANVIATQGELERGVQFIEKPFSMQDLSAKVRAALLEKD